MWCSCTGVGGDGKRAGKVVFGGGNRLTAKKVSGSACIRLAYVSFHCSCLEALHGLLRLQDAFDEAVAGSLSQCTRGPLLNI